MSCPRCENLPEPYPQSGKLYIVPPEFPTGQRLRKVFDELGVAYEQPYPNVYEAAIAEGVMDRLVHECFSKFTDMERQDTKCMVVSDGRALGVQDLVRMQSLQVLMARVDGEWLQAILREERLVTYFQPILNATRPDEVFAYECLVRGKDADGSIVPPFKMFQQARTADLLFQLDRAARLSAIRDASKHNISGRLFINFTPSSIYDASFCLKTTVAAIEKAGINPAQVVFEVVESEEVADVEHLLNILNFYRANGYRVALDDLGAGYSSLNLLHRLQPDFVKLDMALIRGVDTDAYKANICANLLTLAQKLDVPTIAEGVETHGEWAWVRDHGATLVQGYLFAKPDAVPPTPVAPSLVT